MIHAYFNVDLQIIWEIVHGDMPVLKQNMQCILDAVIEGSSLEYQVVYVNH
jgi:uncharacterized protein with HEPN domain